MTTTDWTHIRPGDQVEFAPVSDLLPPKVTGTVAGTRIEEGKPMLMIGAEGRTFDRRPWNVIFVDRPEAVAH